MIKLELTFSIPIYFMSLDLSFISFCVVCDWSTEFGSVQVIDLWSQWIPAAIYDVSIYYSGNEIRNLAALHNNSIKVGI